MNTCLTKELVFKEVSGCLVENPTCGFAQKFGFSFVCRHPDHVKFHAHTSGALTLREVIERYDVLKEKRRDEFIANLDEEKRRIFCFKTDFLGQPI